jgi:hypothetical protein
MFFASSDDFDAIDGRVFPRARAIERQLRKLARARPLRKPAAPALSPA